MQGWETPAWRNQAHWTPRSENGDSEAQKKMQSGLRRCCGPVAEWRPLLLTPNAASQAPPGTQ